MNRRLFLHSLSGGLAAATLGRRALGAEAAIDRRARVGRHDPIVRSFDPLAPLSVGNGRFAFTADATGLQTFAEEYREIPLATQAEWGWHSFPNPAGYRLEDALVEYDAHGRRVPYASVQQSAAGAWLRQNPHRLSLARVGFVLCRPDGAPASPAEVREIEQRLDLWTGTIESGWRLGERAV